MRSRPAGTKVFPDALPAVAGFLVSGVTAILLATGPAFAAGPATAGRQLAMDGCSACHKVAAGQKQPEPVYDPDQAKAVSAPTFADIARIYRKRPQALRGIILDPKHPMPAQNWDERDVKAVVAYIESIPLAPQR